MSRYEADSRPHMICAARTYELTCARRDPWGCAMFGRALILGAGVARDLGRAAAVLPGACEADEADPACEAARRLMTGLAAATAPAP